MRRELSNNKLVRHYYDSTADLRESTKNPSVRNSSTFYNIVTDEGAPHRGQKWLGCDSFADVDRLTTGGWKEGLVMMEKCIGEVNVPAPVNIKRRKVRSDFGDEIDIHQVYGGNLDTAWTRTTRHPISSVREVTLYVDLGAAWTRSSEDMVWKGAAAVAIVDALEEAGYSTKVIGYNYATEVWKGSGPKDLLLTVVLKEAGQVLDKETLAAAVGLSGYFRKYIFSAYMVEDSVAHSYMGHQEAKHDWKPETSNELVINIHHCFSLQTAQVIVTKVVGQLEEQLQY